MNADPDRNDGNDWRFFADVYAHFTPRFTTRLAEGVHLNIAPEFAVFFEHDYDDAQSLVLGLQRRLLLGVRFDTKRAVVKDQIRRGVSPDIIERADERADERRAQEELLRDDDEKRVTEVEEVRRTFTHEREDERVTTVRYQVDDEDESKWTSVDRDSTIDFAEFDDGDVLHVQESSDDGATWSITRTYAYDRTTGQWNETTLEEWKFEIHYYSTISEDGEPIDNVAFVWDEQEQMWVEYEPIEQHLDVDRYPYTTTRSNVRGREQNVQFEDVIDGDGTRRTNVPFVYDLEGERWVELDGALPPVYDGYRKPSEFSALNIQYYSVIADDGTVIKNVPFIYDETLDMWVELEPILLEPTPLFIASAEEPVVVEAPAVVEEPTVVAPPAPIVQATPEPAQEAVVVIEKAEEVKESGPILTAGEEEEPGVVVVTETKRKCPWWWILLLLLLLLLIFFAWYRYKNRKDETHGPDDPISSKPDSSTVPTMDKTIKALWPNIGDGINKGTKATAAFFAKGYRGAKGWILGLFATAQAKLKAEPKATPELKVEPKVAAAIVVPPVEVERNRTGKTCTEAGEYHCSEHPERTVNMGEGKRFPPCRGDGRGHSAVWELTKE